MSGITSSASWITGTTWTAGNDFFYNDDDYYHQDHNGVVRTNWARIREPNIGIGIGTLKLSNDSNRKEKTDMLNRQTFLDALADEGKVIAPEGRDIIRDAEAGKLELLYARLLARAFESSDLAMLKEKPKEVLIKEA